jgi:parallel beta-helix repeat protein
MDFSRQCMTCFFAGFFMIRMATAANYYVSPHGLDENNGQSRKHPWKSITKVNSMMDRFKPGDSILFQRGAHYRGQLDVGISGAPEKPIVFSAYGAGTLPEIRATRLVNNWKHAGVRLWKTTTHGPEIVTALFVGGKSKPLGREPDRGYRPISFASDRNSIVDRSLSDPDAYWTGAEAVVRSSRWTIDRVSVTKQQHGSFTFREPLSYQAKAGFGYFLQNHVHALNREGEWCHDAGKQELIYYSTDDPNRSVIEISVYPYAIRIAGGNYITLQDLAITGAATANVIATGSKGLTIKGCMIYAGGGNGMQLTLCPDARILLNSITDSNNNGIDVATSHRLFLKGNRVIRSAVVAGRGWSRNGTHTGIKINQCDSARIWHNVVDSSGYTGIHLNAISNCQILENIVDHSCMVKDDGGAIYIWKNTSAGNVIVRNIVQNSVGAPEGTDSPEEDAAHGIYIDDGSANLEISENTVTNCRIGLFVHNAADLKIYGNTLYNNHWQMALIQNKGYEITGCDIRQNNLVCRESFATGAKAGQWPLVIRNADPGRNNFNNNRLINPYVPEIVQWITGSDRSYLDMAKWKASGHGSQDFASPVKYRADESQSTIPMYRFEVNRSGKPLHVKNSQTMIRLDGTKMEGDFTIPPYGSFLAFTRASGKPQ